MCKEDYKENYIDNLAENEKHFWFTHRNKIILGEILKWSIKSKDKLYILEIGAGSGNISRYLKLKGFRVDASDMYESAIGCFKNHVDNAFIFNVLSGEISENCKGKYDFVIIGDVIEHLNDPSSALKKIKQFLKINGCILVTVPALKELWSEYDSACGHKRRYTKNILDDELNRSGLIVKEIRYFMFFPVIFILFRRKIFPFLHKTEANWEREFQISIRFNFIMDFILKVERMLNKYIDFPFGSSLIAVAEKNGKKYDEK